MNFVAARLGRRPARCSYLPGHGRRHGRCFVSIKLSSIVLNRYSHHRRLGIIVLDSVTLHISWPLTIIILPISSHDYLDTVWSNSVIAHLHPTWVEYTRGTSSETSYPRDHRRSFSSSDLVIYDGDNNLLDLDDRRRPQQTSLRAIEVWTLRITLGRPPIVEPSSCGSQHCKLFALPVGSNRRPRIHFKRRPEDLQRISLGNYDHQPCLPPATHIVSRSNSAGRGSAFCSSSSCRPYARLLV